MKKFLYGNINSLILTGLVAGYIYLFLQPTPTLHEEHSTFCLFHLVTGIPCPTCGTGRGLICLLHGQWQSALLFNPLSFVVAALSIFIIAAIIKDKLYNTNSFSSIVKVKIPASYYLPAIILLLANEVWNIYKGL